MTNRIGSNPIQNIMQLPEETKAQPAKPQVENIMVKPQPASQPPTGKNLSSSLRQMENVSASMVANQLKGFDAKADVKADATTPSTTTTKAPPKTISSGSVFKEVLNIGLATSSDKGSKLTAGEAKVALDTFGWGDGAVKKSEVLAVKIELGELNKSGKLSPEASKVFSDWLTANANAPAGGQDSRRRADVFRDLESFVRYSPDSQSGAKVSPAEATALLNILGPKPSPARINEVAQLRDSLKGSKQATTTAIRDFNTWLTAHPMPPVPASLTTALQPVIKDLLWPSETDREILPVALGNAPSPRANIANALRTALGEGASTVVDVGSFDDTFAQLSSGDPNDPDSLKQAARFAALGDTLKSQLTDLHVFKVGDIDRDVFVLGRTPDGKWAGVMSGVVET